MQTTGVKNRKKSKSPKLPKQQRSKHISNRKQKSSIADMCCKIRLFKQTNCCVCFRYAFALIQFIFLFLILIFEFLFFVISFICTLSLYAYPFEWRWYTLLSSMDAQHNPSSLAIDDGPLPLPLPPATKFITASSKSHGDNVDTTDNDEHNTPRPAAATPSISILTQNLWCHYLAPSPCKTDRIQAFIQYIESCHPSPTILLLQEIFGIRFGPFVKCPHLKLLTKALSVTYPYHSKPSGILPYFGQNGGTMIFSKYPIVEFQTHRFNDSDEIMLRKGFTTAVITVGDRYCVCVSAHCDPYRVAVINSQMRQTAAVTASICDRYSVANGDSSADATPSSQSNGDVVVAKNTVDIDTGIDSADGIIRDSRERRHSEVELVPTTTHLRNMNGGNGKPLDVIIAGDFNTRNKELLRSIGEIFAGVKIGGEANQIWDATESKPVTYRSAYLSKARLNLSLLTCGCVPLPSLSGIDYQSVKGHCLDHMLTNAARSRVSNVRSVDSRHENVFVSDHLGILCNLSL